MLMLKMNFGLQMTLKYLNVQHHRNFLKEHVFEEVIIFVLSGFWAVGIGDKD